MISYMIRNGSWVFLGNIALALLAFVATALISHLLPKESFGIYRMILSVIPLLAISTLPDMGSAITRSIAKGHSLNLKKVVGEKIKHGLIGSGLALVLSIYYFLAGNQIIGGLFLIVVFGIPFFDVFLSYINALYGIKAFKQASLYLISSRVFSTLLIIFVVLNTENLLIILATFFVSQIIPQYFYFHKVERNHFSTEAESDGGVVQYGKELTAIGVFATLAAQADKLLVWHFLGAEALAIYVVALLITSESGRIAEALSATLLPYLSEAVDHNHIRTVLRTLPWLTLVLTIVAFVAMLLMPILFSLVFPSYLIAISLAQVSVFLIVLIPINSILYRYLIAEKLRRKMLTLYSSKLMVFIVVFILTISSLGLLAPVIALISSEFVSSGFLLSTILKRSNHQNESNG